VDEAIAGKGELHAVYVSKPALFIHTQDNTWEVIYGLLERRVRKHHCARQKAKEQVLTSSPICGRGGQEKMEILLLAGESVQTLIVVGSHGKAYDRLLIGSFPRMW